MSDTAPILLPPVVAPLTPTPLPAPVTGLTDAEVAALGGTIVPLYIYPIPPKQPDPAPFEPSLEKKPDLGHKIGIVVDVTIPSTGATATNVLYEFDTGGKGFWASQGQFTASGSHPVVPSAGNAANLGAVITQYSSGITYLGTGVVATVSLPQAVVPNNGPVPSVTTGMAVVETILDLSDGQEVSTSFPIFGNFFGDFGVSLQQTATVTPPLKHNLPQPFNQQVPSQQPALLSIMAQLGVDSFIVDLVTPTAPAAALGAGTPPAKAGRLILGQSSAFAPYFPQYQQMTATGTTYTPPQASTAIATYEEALLFGALGVGSNQAVGVPVVFDTGAPGVMLHSGDQPPQLSKDGFTPAVGDQLLLNTQLESGEGTDSESNTQSLLSFTVGEVVGENAASMAGIVGQTQSGYINTGLTSFLAYQIMYDLQNGLIRFPAQGKTAT